MRKRKYETIEKRGREKLKERERERGTNRTAIMKK